MLLYMFCRGDHHPNQALAGNKPSHDNLSSSDEESVSRKSSLDSLMSNDAVMTDVTQEMATAVTSEEVSTTASSSSEGNNNSLPKEISYAELELLKKLEEQNR